jgi:hypothetical protein
LPFLAEIGKKYQPDDLFPLSAFNKPDTKALRALILKYLPERDNIFFYLCSFKLLDFYLYPFIFRQT